MCLIIFEEKAEGQDQYSLILNRVNPVQKADDPIQDCNRSIGLMTHTYFRVLGHYFNSWSKMLVLITITVRKLKDQLLYEAMQFSMSNPCTLFSVSHNCFCQINHQTLSRTNIAIYQIMTFQNEFQMIV